MKQLLETFIVRCIRGSLNLGIWVLGFFLGDPPENINGSSLDFDLYAFIAFRGPFDPDRLTKHGLDWGRTVSSWGMKITGPKAVRLSSLEDRVIDGPEAEIPIRIYDPDPSEELPGCVFYHGGGFVIGDLDSHDGFCRLLARDANCRVISVDYRCAPEHRFPAAVEDAVASFQWVQEHAYDLNIDSAPLAVAGDSAGATLATVVCQHQIEHGGDCPNHQLLMYPMTDVAEDYPSRHQKNEQILLPWKAAEWFGEQYVSEGDVDSVEDYRLSPLRFDRLGKMPPAIVATAGFDPLRDEDFAYVERLKENGVRVRHRHYDHLVHGFVTFGGVSGEAKQATEELIREVKETWDTEGPS